VQHGTLSHRNFVQRRSGRLIDNPGRIVVLSLRTDAAKGLSPVLVLINGAAIRIEIKHLKTNDVRISNLRYSPVLESENGRTPPESRSPLPPRRDLSAVADGRPWTPGRLIYGAAIRIEIKHLKTNDVRISNLRYSPIFELRTRIHASLVTSHSPLASAFRYPA
jgi:hypothetical protein